MMCAWCPCGPTVCELFSRDQNLRVSRSDAAPGKVVGRDQLTAALHHLREPVRHCDDLHVKFKLFRVEPMDHGTIATEVYFHAWGETARRRSNRPPVGGLIGGLRPGASHPKFVASNVDEYEEVSTRDRGAASPTVQ